MFEKVDAATWYNSLSMSKQAEVAMCTMELHDKIRVKCGLRCMAQSDHASSYLQVAKRLGITIQTHHHDGWLYIQRI